MTAPSPEFRGKRVMVTSAYDDPEPITSFRRLIAQDRFGVHTVTDDPEAADFILFVENSHYHDDVNFAKLRAHPWVSRYREKVFMYNEHDRPWCVLPGIYASMPARYFDRRRQRAGSYVQSLNPHIEESRRWGLEPDLLCSFVGAANAPVRKRLLNMDRPNFLVSDTSGTFQPYRKKAGDSATTDAMRGYAETSQRSRFVLCPRGVGTGSYRLFETMQAGRVPVVLSDQYVFPTGPDWPQFSLRVPERETAGLPELLASKAGEWQLMASHAREAWETWFAPDVLFHRMIEDLLAIRRERRLPELVAQRIPQPTYLEWRARAALRPLRARVSTWRREQ